MNNILLTVLTGGVLGVLGQGVRVLIGLKKLRESTGGSEDVYFKLLDTSRIFISIFIGFVTGGVAALSLGKPIDNPDMAFTLIGIGYLGVDFIEGLFLRRIQPALQNLTGLQAGSATETAPGGATAATGADVIRTIVRDEIASVPVANAASFTGTTAALPQNAFVVNYSFYLAASVGRNGRNLVQDVRALKSRFQKLGYNWLTINEEPDEKLIGVINLFQSIIRGSETVSGDGLISVPGTENSSYRWLQADNAPRWTKLSPGSRDDRSLGFWNSSQNDQPADFFGTHWLTDTIQEAGNRYFHQYLKTHAGASVMYINDLSEAQGGNVSDHKGHETGLMVDVRLPRTDGKSGQITWKSQEYDRDAARAIITAFKNTSIGTQKVFFNDEVLIGEGLCKALAGHNDHLHIQIKVPSKQILITA